MESRAKLLGHPIHQMLIVFPLGLLVSSVIFDILYLTTGNELFPAIAFYNIAGGLIGGLIAAIFGFIDYRHIPNDTRAKKIGRAHGFGNLVVMLFFSFSWLIRANIPGYLPETLSQTLSFLGLAVGGFTAWLGGELVDRLGVGVDPGANLNAPSSLSGEPAAPTNVRSQQAVPVTGTEQSRLKEVATETRDDFVQEDMEDVPPKVIDEP